MLKRKESVRQGRAGEREGGRATDAGVCEKESELSVASPGGRGRVAW